ncbi:MAG: aminotransferase class I/II-fold pyridoxal phosphate-dependent enzyme [Polyangiaceae bacterium]|jgi:threonine aldolase|nr:aminotransferase class I/II-fold pyridoxal phosphate-dependent enzyme [Polyangiaceae bacterium]MBK8938594.1 aminotransferase class I/II-fold pyridoxal phosphate-dependent enzyme [Polyangiaceae bacterium]
MPIDLRSDTVTKPSAAMRRAMAEAEVGDDVYGEDPTARALEERVAALLGKQAGLFVPSGTMGNQIAIACHSERGDEVYAGGGSHCIWYESGAAAAWSGVQLVEVGQSGLFTAEELDAAIKPRAYYCPNPRLVVVENTHNRGGGRVFPQERVLEVAEVARRHGLSLHLDGARLWNAAVATGRGEAELAAPFDTASVCFSKGLGAPVGSVLVGPSALLEKARRLRKMLGGGMRQIGVLAAACLYALEHHRSRLAADHEHAARFAELARTGRGAAAPAPETNIVMVDLDRDAAPIVVALAEQGVLVSAFGPRRLRVVTHLDVGAADVERAARALVAVLGGGGAP